jgi:hypothetical protein
LGQELAEDEKFTVPSTDLKLMGEEASVVFRAFSTSDGDYYLLKSNSVIISNNNCN